MDAQSLRELFVGGAMLELIDETSIQSFRFSQDGRVLATFGSKPNGPVCAFGESFFVTDAGAFEFGKPGSDDHFVWEDVTREGDIFLARREGRVMRFRFTPGKPKPKPYLP